jgi:membrane associated rhomboid family serine protease
MSAWSVGATSRPAVRAELAADSQGVKGFVDKLVVWIPGDVVSLYVAGVTAMGVASPQPWFVLVIVFLAPAVVLLGNASLKPPERQSHLVRRAILAAFATAIWTLAVPGSGWQAIAWIKDNASSVAVVAAAIGLVFGLAASALIPKEEA